MPTAAAASRGDARATRSPSAGDLDGAEAVLRAVAGAVPALRARASRRGRGCDARRGGWTTRSTALGRAVDLDGGRADAVVRAGRRAGAPRAHGAGARRPSPRADAGPRTVVQRGARTRRSGGCARRGGRVDQVRAGAAQGAGAHWPRRGRSRRRARLRPRAGEGWAIARATEWLTRAARAADARAPVIVEAAAATADPRARRGAAARGAARA